MKNKNYYLWMAVGASTCALYVALGAFGAHGLEGRISSAEQATFQTGLRYMAFHGMALILVNLLALKLEKNALSINWAFSLGILLFSVSLMIHACKSLLAIDINAFAMVAPLGGLSFIIGWILLTIKILKQ